jgi:hypothetical protein
MIGSIFVYFFYIYMRDIVEFCNHKYQLKHINTNLCNNGFLHGVDSNQRVAQSSRTIGLNCKKKQMQCRRIRIDSNFDNARHVQNMLGCASGRQPFVNAVARCRFIVTIEKYLIRIDIESNIINNQL